MHQEPTQTLAMAYTRSALCSQEERHSGHWMAFANRMRQLVGSDSISPCTQVLIVRDSTPQLPQFASACCSRAHKLQSKGAKSVDYSCQCRGINVGCPLHSLLSGEDRQCQGRTSAGPRFSPSILVAKLRHMGCAGAQGVRKGHVH